MRRRDPHRLTASADAANRVFGRRGFERTQMAEVAAEAGVSVGTLYNYVVGKDALLLVGALAAFGDLEVDALPYEVSDRAALIERLRAAVQARIVLPSLAGDPPDGPATVDDVGTVVGELFDLLAATREAADAFERCASEAPDLAAVFYVDARGHLLAVLERFVADRVRDGAGPALPPPAVAARHVLETVTWFARHRHHDPEVALTDGEARAAAIALLTRTLCAPST